MFEDVFCSLSYLFAVFYVDGRGGSTPLVRISRSIELEHFRYSSATLFPLSGCRKYEKNHPFTAI